MKELLTEPESSTIRERNINVIKMGQHIGSGEVMCKCMTVASKCGAQLVADMRLKSGSYQRMEGDRRTMQRVK